MQTFTIEEWVRCLVCEHEFRVRQDHCPTESIPDDNVYACPCCRVQQSMLSLRKYRTDRPSWPLAATGWLAAVMFAALCLFLFLKLWSNN